MKSRLNISFVDADRIIRAKIIEQVTYELLAKKLHLTGVDLQMDWLVLRTSSGNRHIKY